MLGIKVGVVDVVVVDVVGIKVGVVDVRFEADSKQHYNLHHQTQIAQATNANHRTSVT